MSTKNPRLPLRTFLQQSALAAGALGTAPLILGATDKAGSNRPRVGAGDYIFECYHDWGLDALPEGHHYGGASHAVAFDSNGLIYITHHGGPGSIFVFDPDGKFVRSLGEHQQSLDRRSGKTIGRGHGIAIRKEANGEFIYLAPNDVSLYFSKMTLDGELVWKRNRHQLSQLSTVFADSRTRFRPTNTSFRPDGGYYLGDGYGSHTIFEFTAQDVFVRAIGGRGVGDGQFQTPHGQWLDDRDGTPKLVVADRANKRLQWFDMNGQHLRTQDGFLFPADVDVQGDLMIVPDLHARLTLLDRNNRVINHLGDDPAWRAAVLDSNNAMRSKRSQWRPGRFVHPHGAKFDPEGNLFVAEWVVTGRVTKLVRA